MSAADPLHPNAALVVAAAAEAGVGLAVEEFPAGTRTAADAAAAVGCDVAQIVKSLVFLVDGEPVVALVSGPNRLSEARLSAAAGGGAVGRADADAVRAATGFPIGGVPPFAHRRVLRTFVDRDLLALDVVWAAAGTPRHVFPIAPGDLVRLSGATPADLAATPPA
jgi:prolyl-tRNA editing enzyme YbaK/EbsC (Cys-tRNA(Pro) deacylase)